MAKVLIVEDEAFTAMTLVDVLADRGHAVKDAVDGAVAMEILEDFHPCVLITDLMMPNVDGAALIRHVRAMPDKLISIVLITGVPEAKLPHDLDYDAYLGKPVDHETLGRLVEGFDGDCRC
jgi:CheY-like chemotaxis protein